MVTRVRAPAAAILASVACMPTAVLAQNAHVEVLLNETFGTHMPPHNTFTQDANHVSISYTVMLAIAHFASKHYNSSAPRMIILVAAFYVVG
jgi:hypothetical protein